MEQYIPPTSPPSGRRGRHTALAVALVAAGALGGGVIAGTLSASAASSGSSSTQSPSTGSSEQSQTQQDRQGVPGRHGGGDHHGSASVRDDETVLTGDTAAKVKAAALEAVPGGTVYRVETDAGDAEYEAHMTKADGTEVTVKLDKDFTVTAVEDGMGKGDPAPAGAPDGQSGQGGQSGSEQAPSTSPSA